MKAIKRSWLIIVRRSYYSICLYLLVFIFALFGLFGAYLQNIINTYHDLVWKDTGYALFLYRYDEEALPDELLDGITSIDDVTGINQKSDCLMMPVGFSNAVELDSDSVFSQSIAEEIRLLGNTDVSVEPDFTNHAELIAGYFPTTENPGVLIDKYLADYNGIQIGDSLQFEQSETGAITTVTVVGLYRTTSSFQETTVSNNDYTVYGESPYSYVFCDYNTYAAACGISQEKYYVYIYASTYSSLNQIYEEIISMDLDSSIYDLSNYSESEVDHLATTSDIENIATMIITLTSIAALVILFLVIIMWIRANYRDIAILIVLGQHKVKIILQYMGIVTVITVAALALAVPLGLVFTRFLGNSLLQTIIDILGSQAGSETDEYLSTALQQSMSLLYCIKSSLRYLVITWISSAIGFIEVARCNSRILFHAE